MKSAKKKVFIDGSSGTTGLKIRSRLKERDDIELIELNDSNRHDEDKRKDAINNADLVFLCLPDDEAIKSASMLENDKTIIIDTSTAHRTNNKWCYGFPELLDFREKVRNSKKIANPGCHASGFLALIAPLREVGILPSDASLSCFSITGYSGGGKKMIAEYEDKNRDVLLNAPRLYGITQEHKHLKEMKKIASLESYPIFNPVVAPFYSGMEVIVPLFPFMLENHNSKIADIKKNIEDIYSNCYTGKAVKFKKDIDNSGFISSATLSNRDDMIVSVIGNNDRLNLIAVFDNLGKGASGSAIQNMNLVFGYDEYKGLVV